MAISQVYVALSLVNEDPRGGATVCRTTSRFLDLD